MIFSEGVQIVPLFSFVASVCCMDHLTVIQAYSLAYQRRGNLELAKLGLRGVTVLAASGDTGIQGAAQQGGPPPRCAPFAAAPRHSKDGYDCFFGQLRDRFFKDLICFFGFSTRNLLLHV